MVKILRININSALILMTPMFIAALFIFRSAPELQFLTFVAASFLYIGLAVLHHIKDKTFTLEIMIEYILIAALALIILQSLFF